MQTITCPTLQRTGTNWANWGQTTVFDYLAGTNWGQTTVFDYLAVRAALETVVCPQFSRY